MVAFREVGAAIGLGLRVAGVARRFFLAVGSGFVAAGARGGCPSGKNIGILTYIRYV